MRTISPRIAVKKISKLTIGFIPDEAVILTHSYSRVVMHALLYANKRRRISVFVTEARPRGLGVRTYEALSAAGIPCALVLDSAVAYVMDKIDLVLVGSEAVVESGGLINAVGSYQMSIVAKAANKPVYALAESYKFLRSFPLSQYDLPMPNAKILSILSQRPASSQGLHDGVPKPWDLVSSAASSEPVSLVSAKDMTSSPSRYHPPPATPTFTISADQLSDNPEVDYTKPELISNVVSDVGILTPSAVSQYLVQIFAD